MPLPDSVPRPGRGLSEGSDAAQDKQRWSQPSRCFPLVGTGVICEIWAFQAAVIPAKPGIYSANLRKCVVDGLDSRFRGNDRRSERDPIPNDTTTHLSGGLRALKNALKNALTLFLALGTVKNSWPYPEMEFSRSVFVSDATRPPERAAPARRWRAKCL